MANYRDVVWTRKYLEQAEKGLLPAEEDDGAADCLVLPGAQWKMCIRDRNSYFFSFII